MGPSRPNAYKQIKDHNEVLHHKTYIVSQEER